MLQQKSPLLSLWKLTVISKSNIFHPKKLFFTRSGLQSWGIKQTEPYQSNWHWYGPGWNVAGDNIDVHLYVCICFSTCSKMTVNFPIKYFRFLLISLLLSFIYSLMCKPLLNVNLSQKQCWIYSYIRLIPCYMGHSTKLVQIVVPQKKNAFEKQLGIQTL